MTLPLRNPTTVAKVNGDHADRMLGAVKKIAPAPAAKTLSKPVIDPRLSEMGLFPADDDSGEIAPVDSGFSSDGASPEVDEEILRQIQKEYEELLDEKSETIRQLHLDNQEMKKEVDKLRAAASLDADELQAYAEELKRDFQEIEHLKKNHEKECEELERDREKLEREYEQMREDKECMEQDLGRMEAELAQERVAVQRQRMEFQRLLGDVKREYERLKGDKGDLQEKLRKLKQLSEIQPVEAGPQKSEGAGGGFFGRFLGKGK